MMHAEHGTESLCIPPLQAEQKIVATLSTEQTKCLVQFKPKGAYVLPAHLLASAASPMAAAARE
jgi:hypothetical protein